MKIKNKLFLILVISILFVILISSNVFASEVNTDLTDKDNYKIDITFNFNDVDFDTLNYRALLYDPISDYYYFYVSDNNFTIRDRADDDNLVSGSYGSSILLEIGEENTVLYSFLLGSDCYSINDDLKTITIYNNKSSGIVDCSFLITNYNGCMEIPIYRTEGGYSPDYSLISTSDFQYVGNAVFPQPPQGTILAPIVEEVETEKTLAQILAVLPIVIVVIVGILAVRKAIKVLLNLLKRS